TCRTTANATCRGRLVGSATVFVPQSKTSEEAVKKTILALAALALIVAGCGGSSKKSSTTTATMTKAAGAGGGGTFKVGLVTDLGGLNDRGLNPRANGGLTPAPTAPAVH